MKHKTPSVYLNGENEVVSSEATVINSHKTCNSCPASLGGNYIECGDCSASLCFNCFRKGKAFENHRSDHKYSIVRTDFDLLEPGWTADEEGRLLDCMQDCGYGNWEYISKFFKNKNQDTIEKHFNQFYIEDLDSELAPKFSTLREVTISNPLPIPALVPAENPPRPSRKVGNVIKELADYNPARGEFGVEYDNLAEADVLENLGDIAQLVNNQTEQLTSELALAILDSYSRRLKKRAQIKRLVRSYSLISKRRAFSHTLRYKNIKCSSWSWNELSVFCQLISPFAMDYLMEGLLLEANLKCNILKLQNTRQHGLKMVGSIVVMDNLLKVREEHVRQLSSNIIPGDSADAKTSRLLPPGNLSDWNMVGSSSSRPSLSGPSASRFLGSQPPRRCVVPLDILGLQGYERLNLDEKQLCSNIRLFPHLYLEVKSLLERESEVRGGLRLADARQLVKIDVNKTRKLYDFFVREGIIKKGNS